MICVGEIILAIFFPCTTLSLYNVYASEVYKAFSSFIEVLHEKVNAKMKAKAEAKVEAEEYLFIGRWLQTNVIVKGKNEE